MTAASTCDVAVIGLGAMGSAAVHHLARGGARVVGVDQHAPPHALGSTHGDSRVTRVATAEGDAYVPLAARSHQLWRELEEESGAELFTACGVLMLGPRSGGAGLHGVADWIGATIEVAGRHGVEHEVLDGREAIRRFPMFELTDDCRAYWEPGGGFVRPEASVTAHLQLAERRGAQLRRHTKLTGLEPDGDGVRLELADGSVRADHVVVATGAWLPGFIANLDLAARFTVRRQVLHWFDVAPEWAGRAGPDACPVYISAFGQRAEDCFYGFPAIDGPAGGMKVASEQATASTTAEAVKRTVEAEESRTLYERLLRPRLRAVTERCLRSAVCLYTVTPDSGFVIDAHPELPATTIVSACSGHGFKHSAAIGEAVAQRFLAGRSRLDLSAFALRDPG